MNKINLMPIKINKVDMAAHHNNEYMVKYFIEKDNYSSYAFDIFVKRES
jgi:hypothetical protein